MIRNRYNYLTPSKTQKGKKDALKVTVSQSEHYKQKAKRTAKMCVLMFIDTNCKLNSIMATVLLNIRHIVIVSCGAVKRLSVPH